MPEYYPACSTGYWWVTTEIDVIFVMIIVAVTLWIVKLYTGIYANWSSAKVKSYGYLWLINVLV